MGLAKQLGMNYPYGDERDILRDETRTFFSREKEERAKEEEARRKRMFSSESRRSHVFEPLSLSLPSHSVDPRHFPLRLIRLA